MSEHHPSQPTPSDAEEHKERWRIWATQAPGNAAFAASGLSGAIGFATTAINSAVLLNGAAATAMLALLGSVWGSASSDVLPLLIPKVAECLWYFGGGAVVAVCAAGLAYVSQSAFNEQAHNEVSLENTKLVYPNWTPDAKKERYARIARNFGIALQIAGIVAFIGSITLFCIGAGKGLSALQLVAEAFPNP